MAPAVVDAGGPPAATLSYRYQIVLADAATLAMFCGSLATYGAAPALSDRLAFASMGTYVLAPAAIHLAHRRPWRALGSAGLRLGLPAATTVAYWIATGPHTGSDAEIGHVLAALVAGLGTTVLAGIIDVLFIARPLPVDEAGGAVAARASGRHLAWAAPVLVPGGMGLGLGAAF